ncbi:MAG: metal ABC transporter permease [Anaerolineae bacterium]|nr:metal ABC transporter permease [Anaerolineae bacterium]
MFEALQFTFMRNALLAGVLVSIACGIIGTFVVIKRIVFISGGIAHAAYGGIGLGYYFKYMVLPLLFTGSVAAADQRPGYWPLVGAILFSLFAALVMGIIQRQTRQRADTIIGVLWAIGMAIGIIFVDLTEGYKVDLMSYLFGSILTVEQSELWIMVGLDGVIIVLVALFYKELVAITFDETFATVENVPVDALYLGLLCLIALTVVMMMRVVGLIMVIAMLTMPAAISGHLFRDMKKMIIGAIVLGVGFAIVGLWVSYTWNLTSGASIILVAGILYLLSLGVKPLRARLSFKV